MATIQNDRSTIVRLSVFDVQASQLHQKLDDVGVKPKVIIAMSTNQMLKVCMSINSIALAEMEFPQAYLEALPENGRPCLGDFLIETSRLITSQQITCLESRDISSGHPQYF
ncbi:rop guanine nucleotide exchange factor 6-like [Brassica napus]|uniref:rop guanine nucleotide exchange factor 6-like n=1 Tax=Brassica napus TaxID=3708 RepID=UPI002078A17F|nr:rop guanine nucleotide exchange factor 6-like [Brassica napus]